MPSFARKREPINSFYFFLTFSVEASSVLSVHVTSVTLAYTILGVRVASYTDDLRGSSRVPLRQCGIDASVSKKKAEQHCGYHPFNTPPMQALSQLIQCNQKYNVIFFLLINFSSLQKSKNHQEDKAKFDSKLRWLFDGDDELCLGRHRNTSYLIF